MGQLRLRLLALTFLLVGCNLPVVDTGNPLHTAIAETLAAVPLITATATEPNQELGNQTDPDEPSGQIVYVCQYSKLSGFNQICIMDADGSKQRVLTPPSNADNLFPSISCDGQFVYFASDRSGGYQLYRLPIESDELEQLTRFEGMQAYAPAESPDGNLVAFYARKAGEVYPQSHSIWIMNVDGSDQRQLTFLDGGGWDPAWSPDSRQILFASEINDQPQLFIVDIESGETYQVTDIDGIRGRNDWSPNGFLLSSYIGVPWDRDIYTFDLQGENLTQLTDGDNNLAPSFSPDGAWITFMSYRDHPLKDLGCEIYIMHADGSNARRLTDNDICDWQPRWGP